MEDLAALTDLANKSDEPIRRRLLLYVELRQSLAELTGNESVSEATPMLGRLYEHHPHRREIVLTAGRLRALGRVVFSRLG